ncbi:MAG: glycosyltransferase family 4 protein, partial [Armatimonadetes bacterium]|nr:glycosyltransferase family 4 protein [Armatimonadota bacterium]
MDYKVIISASKWDVGGVTVFCENLARGLLARSVSAEILLTQPYLESKNPLPMPEDIVFSRLAVVENDTWERHWKVFMDYLESQAPCVYIPNHDYRHSCVSPRLSRRVGIVGVLHSDESIYYDHAARLGRYWNAIVAVSKVIAEKTARIDPSFAPRMYTIPYGVTIPCAYRKRPYHEGSPLRIIYAGRIIQHQKRIMDLPKIMAELVKRQVMTQWTIIGSGPEQEAFIGALQPLIQQGASVRLFGARPNKEVLAAFEQNDVFILTSEFEGTPLTLLEAMGRGCVPV